MVDYRKYKYYANDNDYSMYKIGNYIGNQSKNKKLNITKNTRKSYQKNIKSAEFIDNINGVNKEVSTSNNANINIVADGNISSCAFNNNYVNTNGYTCKNIYDNSKENKNNISTDSYTSTNNILGNCSTNCYPNKNTNEVKKSLNIDNNYNINLNNKDLESTSNSKKRTHKDLISDEEVKKILEASYPDEDTSKDYILNENLYQNSLNIKQQNPNTREENFNKSYTKKSYYDKSSSNQLNKDKSNYNKLNQTKVDYTNSKYNQSNNSHNNRKYNRQKSAKTSQDKSSTHDKTSRVGITGGIVLLLIFVTTFCICNYFLPSPIAFENKEVNLFFVGKYAISMEDANNISNSFKIKGGAGYIYKYNGKLFVIADMYKSEENAKSIIEKSENKNFFDKIINIKVREYCYEYIPKNLNSVVSSALKYIDIACYQLQDISYNLSCKEMDVVEAKDRVKRLAKSIKQIGNIYQNNIGSSSNEKVLKLKSNINIAYNLLNDLHQENSLVVSIRYAYISNIIYYINLIEDSYTK